MLWGSKGALWGPMEKVGPIETTQGRIGAPGVLMEKGGPIGMLWDIKGALGVPMEKKDP